MSDEYLKGDLNSIQSDYYCGNLSFSDYSRLSSECEMKIRQAAYEDAQKVEIEIQKQEKKEIDWPKNVNVDNNADKENKKRLYYEEEIKKTKDITNVILNGSVNIDYELVIENYLKHVAINVIAKSLILNDMLFFIETRIGKKAVSLEVINERSNSELYNEERIIKKMNDVLFFGGKTADVNV